MRWSRGYGISISVAYDASSCVGLSSLLLSPTASSGDADATDVVQASRLSARLSGRCGFGDPRGCISLEDCLE